MANVKTAKKRHKRALSQKIGRVLTIIDGIARRPFKRSDKIGFDAEDEVLKQGKYFHKKKIIKLVKLFDRFSGPDQEGRDMMIELLTNKIIGISITAAYHREDEWKAHQQGNYYLAVYPGQSEQMTREKLLMIILHGYFADLGLGQIREALKIIEGLKQTPVKPKKFWLFR